MRLHEYTKKRTPRYQYYWGLYAFISPSTGNKLATHAYPVPFVKGYEPTTGYTRYFFPTFVPEGWDSHSNATRYGAYCGYKVQRLNTYSRALNQGRTLNCTTCSLKRAEMFKDLREEKTFFMDLMPNGFQTEAGWKEWVKMNRTSMKFED